MNTVYKRLVFLLAALLLIGAAGVPMVSAQDGSDSNEKVIQTSASGDVMVAPDRAQVTVSVRTENADVKVAQAENARIA
ncbi:MAG: SIMPL domain-containing protein, partial [Methanolinea sp.]|nr:SIMPL domain-containing protein [Methanolinea sp.]